MSKITWKNEIRQIDELIPADYNPRKITEKERADLEESIEKYPEVLPIVVNVGSRKNVIIGGHQRTSIYKDKGIKQVEVRVPNRELTREEELELNLRLNKNTAGWDMEKLLDLDVDLLVEVGFGDEELASMWNDVDVLDDGYHAEARAKKITEPTVFPGDIYELGDHRLMCGDSTSEEDVLKLMAGEQADMVYCDPPYNIGLDYDKGVDGKKSTYGGSYSGGKDKKKDDSYRNFVGLTLENALKVTKKDAHVFYWCDEAYIWVMQTLFLDNGIANKRVNLWIKNNAFPKPQIAFNKVYEPCVYGTRGKPYLNKALNSFTEMMNPEIGTGNATIDDILSMINLWLFKKDATQDYDHPTQKPVNLHERALKRCTAPGHTVLDLFGGSGSTLMACEQLKRKTRMMEIDPIFATVILERWEEYSGRKAKKIS